MVNYNKKKARTLKAASIGGNPQPKRGYLFRFSFLSLYYGGSWCKVEIDFRKGGESVRALQLFCNDGRLWNWLNTDVNANWYKAVGKRRNKGDEDADGF